MLVEQLALVAATAFTAVAVYSFLVEQPVRIDIAPPALLAQWKISYKRATVMQVTFALEAGVLGFVAFVTTQDGAGSAVETADERVLPEVRRWARLHAGRTGLGLAAVLVYLSATLRALRRTWRLTPGSSADSARLGLSPGRACRPHGFWPTATSRRSPCGSPSRLPPSSTAEPRGRIAWLRATSPSSTATALPPSPRVSTATSTQARSPARHC